VRRLRLPVLLIVCGFTTRAAERPFTTWSQYLDGPDSSQYSSLKQINKSNVTKLDVAWTYPTGPGTFVFDPIVVDGVMYVLVQNNSVVALDAATGKELWVHPNTGAVGARGMNYWESKDRSDRRQQLANGSLLGFGRERIDGPVRLCFH
jgi:quinoprotein glucose dehydrogenase